jgi:cobyrinic acid a,c-diamide synthase
VPPLLAGKTIAVGRDAAFCFIYPANLECLQALGARVAFFSPLADADLPDCDAVWLPGGYPELHTEALGANAAMAAALKAHVADGKPLLAECGGMMACFDCLAGLDGIPSPAFGLLPGLTRMQGRLAALGMQAVDWPAGRLCAHTFHYSQCETSLAPLLLSVRLAGPQDRPGEAVYRREQLTASYLHFYFPSCPAAAAALFLP